VRDVRAMKLTIYTKGKKWEFDHSQSDWVISDNWVEVRTIENKTFIFPIHRISLLIITFPEEAEAEKAKEGRQK
jgi:hypothetical protein